MKAINFCSTDAQGEVQDFAGTALKELGDEIVAEFNPAVKELTACVNLSFPLFSHFSK